MKFLKYILIVIVLAGFFSPIFQFQVNAADPIGLCIVGGEQYINTTKASCDLLAKNLNKKQDSWKANETQPGGTAVDPNYVLLAPIEGFENFNPTDKNALGNYLNIMIKIIIGLCAVLAVVMIVAGGIEYMTSELISSKEQGKTRITEALLGLLVALGAYALLNTINPTLLDTKFESLKDVKVEVDLQADVPQTPVNGKYKNGATYGNPWDDTVGPRATLPQYVTVYNSECSTIGQTNCTSTRKLDVSLVQKIQYGCKCVLTITGGTESWLHGGYSGNTSHQLGSSTVDLRRTPELDKYLSNGKPLVKMERYGPNKEYLFEGDHWHIGP